MKLKIKLASSKNDLENVLKIRRRVFINEQQIPTSIEIDVADMPISTSLKAKEAPLPDGAKLIGDAEFVIASIIGKRGGSTDIDERTEEEESEGEKTDKTKER